MVAPNSTAALTAPAVVRKVAPADCGLVELAAADKPLRFVISSESPDLAGDVVVQAGLKPARSEIPAQIDHGGSMFDVIGVWKDIVVKGKKTFADLHLLPPGVSRAADLVRAIADAGVRLSASIGFRPTRGKVEEIFEKGMFVGYRYLEGLLVETSVVVVPAQTDAVQVLRSLLSDERHRATLDQLIATRGAGTTPTRSGAAQPGRPLPALLRKGYAQEPHAMKLSDQIVAVTDELNVLRDTQKATTEKLCEATDEETKKALEEEAASLTEQIIAKAKSLDVLKAAEESLKPRTGDTQRTQPTNTGTRSVTKRDDEVDAMNVVRAAGAVFEAYILRVPVEAVLERRYPGREALDFVTKATQNPAMTNVPGWAQELVRETFGAFMELLKPETVVPNLPLQQYSFDGYGSIKIPRRNGATPNLAAAFRAEGAPIRVGAISLAAATLTPKSMGVIATFTNELFERSTPNIETVCREAMIGDTAVALDTAFLSATPGTAIQPAGLQTYATGGNTAASTGNTVAQITADIRGRVQQMYSKGVGRRPVWIMHPSRLAGLQLATSAAGTPAFPSTSGPNPTLLNFPVVTSLSVPSSIVYLIDAAEVAFAGGVPKFLGTEVATLHEEDTAPLPITATGTPNTAAAPVRSLYQTNSSALRALWEVDWTVGRPDGSVQTLTGVAW